MQSTSYARAAPPAATGGTGDPVAVILWHGMGQQIPFETIETVVRALTSGAGGNDNPAHVITRFVRFGAERMWRAEVDVQTSSGRVVPVHFYEVYWAPLTEGKITIREALAFLVRAGLSGLWYVLNPPFRRHLFGQWVSFPTSVSTAAQLAALLLTLAAMVVMNFAIATATSVTVFTGGASRWPSYPLLGDLTADFLVYETVMGAMLAALWAVYWMQRPRREKGRPSTRARWLKGPLWALVLAAMVATIWAGALVVWHVWWHRAPDQVMRWAQPAWLVGAVYGYRPLSFSIIARLAAVWFVALGVSALIRSFIVEYVGDVAIYVASHKLDRFYEARKAIKTESLRVAKAIYRYGRYTRHICVGHSLGSAVAYDTVNRLLNESMLTPSLNVAGRTHALLTFGSPLDKTAFLFRAQSEFSDVREAMAAAAQPMIVDYAVRPIWINIYSSSDPISGRLDYYDAPGHDAATPQRGSAVFNVRDDQGWIPLVAHTQYWTNDAFIEKLRWAIEGS